MNKRPLPISEFIAYSPDHTYIHRPSREIWLQIAVNARVPPLPRPPKKPMSATTWLDRHDAVEQRVWAPGYPEIINDLLVSEGGFFAKRARAFTTSTCRRRSSTHPARSTSGATIFTICGRTRLNASSCGWPTGCNVRERRSTTR
jgi:hypothetical protein